MSSTTESVSTITSAAETPTVHLERMDDGTIAVLTLDDPKRANAMSPQIGDAFTQHVRSLINDTALRAVIVRGAGKDFSIGGHRDMLISLRDGTRSEKELHDFMLAFKIAGCRCSTCPFPSSLFCRETASVSRRSLPVPPTLRLPMRHCVCR